MINTATKIGRVDQASLHEARIEEALSSIAKHERLIASIQSKLLGAFLNILAPIAPTLTPAVVETSQSELQKEIARLKSRIAFLESEVKLPQFQAQRAPASRLLSADSMALSPTNSNVPVRSATPSCDGSATSLSSAARPTAYASHIFKSPASHASKDDEDD